MPVGNAAPRPRRELEAVPRAFEHLVEAVGPHLGRGELEGQREPVEGQADLGDRAGVGHGDPEVREGRANAGDEQRDARHRGQLRHRRQPARIGHGQREDRQQLLARHREGRPAGGDHAHPRAAGQQPGDVVGRVEQVLDVVQHQQHAPLAQVPAQGDRQRLGARVAQAERAGDGGQHVCRVAQRGEVDEHRAVGVLAAQPQRQLQGQPRLARATGADQREEPGRAEQHAGRRDLAVAADQG